MGCLFSFLMFPLKHKSFYFWWSPISSFLLLFVLLVLSKKLWPEVDFPHSSVGKESTCNVGDPGLIPGLGRSAGEGIGYPLQYSWASLVAQLVKNLPAMWETWDQSLGWEDPLEKEKATHSSIQAWRIPWTVWSMGSQRVWHDWVTKKKKKWHDASLQRLIFFLQVLLFQLLNLGLWYILS